MHDVRLLAVTRQEAELLLDSFRVSNPLTRTLCLKAASVVLEYAAENTVRDAEQCIANATPAGIVAGKGRGPRRRPASNVKKRREGAP